MSELKWRRGPVPEDGRYVCQEDVDLSITERYYRRGFIPYHPWIPSSGLNDLPVEDPPLPIATIECSDDSDRCWISVEEQILDNAPWLLASLVEMAECLRKGHDVTLRQGDNTIVIRGEK